MLPGFKGPEYPRALRDAKVEGKVRVQFVLDTAGVSQAASFKILKTDQTEFRSSSLFPRNR